MYTNETNITFQRNLPRLQSTGSSVSQVYFRQKESFCGFVFNQFCIVTILERIVTADETWLHHYEPESKALSMAWKRPTSSVAKKFKSQPSAGRIMLTFFWDMEGAVLINFTPKGETVHRFPLLTQ
jgi:hypothetical protein